MANSGKTSQHNLLDLPNEVLIKIFETLCIHCQTELDTVADYDTSDGWESKRSLARVCRVSHTLCSIAQPILFHYYASGNMQKMIRFREILCKPEEDDRLPAFLCSILKNPTLSRSVRVLSLVPGSFPNGITGETARILVEESERLRLPPPTQDSSLDRSNSTELLDVASSNESRPSSTRKQNVHLWLQGLAISMCPHIEQLHIHYRPPSWLPDIAPGVVLERLAIFALSRGHAPHFYAPRIAQLINAAINLKKLCAADLDFNFELGFDLSGLQKLSINGPTPGVLQLLLSACYRLDDLEYHQDPFIQRIAREATFEPVRQSLRRLCFSIAAYPGDSPYGPESRDTIYFLMMSILDNVAYGDGFCVRGFERLEILEIDYFLLYGRVKGLTAEDESSPPQLPTILPETLRILHIGFVTDWNHMCYELISLASVIKAGRFPQLNTIRVDVVRSACIFEFYSAVEVALSVTKVDFVLGLCPISSVPRGMLPGRPAGADVPPEGMVNYIL